MSKLKHTFVLTLLLVLLLGACQPAPSESQVQPTPLPTQAAQMANPASQYCIDQGGSLAIEERGDGGQFGVCTFEDNLKCEEWAMLNGDCPVGGIKVTGYVTPAARYCAISGGTYSVTGNSNTESEQGTCTFPNGTICDAGEYYNGVCSREDTTSLSTPPATWQWYVSPQVGYALQMPLEWGAQSLPNQNSGNMHGMSYTGAEGGVEIYWGAGLGGACPAGTTPVLLAQGEVQACNTINNDGTQDWDQINYVVDGGNSFSSRLYTSDAQPSSSDLLLQVLSTLTFRVPAEVTIQPLRMEVCDGQAQAMSHALDDLDPTQSTALLDDYMNNAWGTGCQATITGTGEQFENPTPVVSELGLLLKDEGWISDAGLEADGPTGTAQGYRKGDQLCWAGASWRPDASASCPQDQPISACQVTPAQQLYTITLNCGVETAISSRSLQIVFDSNRADSGYRDLYVMDGLGNEVSRVTQGESNSFAGPWSPDGKLIVYTTFGATNSQIAAIHPDGSGQTTLDSIDGSDEAFPAWSPDGSRIAFTSRRDGNNEIYLMNADGSGQIRITSSPGDDFAPSWSPDEARIAFVSDRDQQPGVYDLYIMNSDGSGVSRLTEDSAIDYSPDWSPDGKTIIFRSHHGGPADIFRINIDGTGLTNLTDDPAEDWAPSWSPDGSQIAFQTDRDGNWEIYTMTAAGGDLVNLSYNPADDQLPYFRP